MKGFNGQILHVDLTSGEVRIEKPAEGFYRKYGGGTALGTYYLLKMMPTGIDALSPGNVLAIMTGPATGAAVSGQSRVAIVAKSPLTGGIGDSQGGGFWPATFKRTGFDGIVITGKAEHPVYLHVFDGQAQLRDASHLWGKITGDVEKAIQEELDDTKVEVLQIGPAGENGVRFANILNMCNRANGRTGMGAVMGSKNLKAIAIQGNQKLDFADPKGLKNLARWGADHYPDSGVYGLGIYGTAGVLAGQQGLGGLPTHNWEGGHFDEFENITGARMADTVLKERDTCYACVVRCKRVVEITDGPYKVDPFYGGPEYETLAAFGSYTGVSNLEAICKANELCNKYGMDTISCGATIAWAIDCYEKGIIQDTDTGGLALKFGDPDLVVKLVEMIGKREDFGDILAEGSARAAEKFGESALDLVVTTKKQELPAHMPEAKRSLALIYGVNAFGADHQSHEHDTSFSTDFAYDERMAEIGLSNPQPLRELNEEKVRYSIITQWVYSACNSLSVCQFVYGPAWHLFSTSQLVELVRSAAGWDFSIAELLKLGERTVNLQRLFNIREGFSGKDDVLPKKLFQPKKGGPTDQVAIPREQYDAALAMYYAMAGWDEDGKPTNSKLDELDLGWAV